MDIIKLKSVLAPPSRITERSTPRRRANRLSVVTALLAHAFAASDLAQKIIGIFQAEPAFQRVLHERTPGNAQTLCFLSDQRSQNRVKTDG